MTDPIDLDIARLHDSYARGLDPVVVVEDVFERISAAADPGIFISIADKDAARAAAGLLGPFDPVRKPLYGIPFAVKDNIDVAGFPTTAACPAFSRVAARDAACVERLLAAGGILIGKTNLDQFATGLVGVRTPYGAPRNPFNASIIPGGSSCGSAVAVARGLVSFALGTDTAGSGRVPAGLNNIVGLKPTFGAISTRGVLPACRSLDCVSVFALTVDDAWRAFHTMHGEDHEDPFTRRLFLGIPGAPPPRVRLGIPRKADREFMGDLEAEAAFDAALLDLTAWNIQLVEIDFRPFRETAGLLYGGPWVAERYAAVGRFIEASPESIHPTTREIIFGARNFTSAEAFAGMHRLQELKSLTRRIWNDMDALAVPTAPTAPTVEAVLADPIGLNAGMGYYCNFANLLDLCGMAIPFRMRNDGLPFGLTLLAPAGHDAWVASIARKLQASAALPMGATGRSLPASNGRSVGSPPGWIELAVVGAHLSGMPLNRELREAGGIFLRSAGTRPAYRLYALPGGPPFKPGLLRVGADEGAAIEVEVWALCSEALGRFVAAIPSPLGIGVLQLADGTSPKGFLVESVATKGARDISSFGGWRKYVELAG